MRFFGYVVVAVFLGSSLSNAQDRCPPDSLLARGDSAYLRYDNNQSLDFYRNARQTCPGSYEALMKLTRAYTDVAEETEDDAKADAIFRVALRHADTLRSVYRDSMMGYFLTAAIAGNLAQQSGGERKVKLSRVVEENARKAIERDSTYSPSYVILGSYYRQVATTGGWLKSIARLLYGELPDGTLEDSYRVLNKAVQLDQENPYAHLELAKTLSEMGREEQADKHLRTVIELPISSHYDKELKKEARSLLQQ